METVSDFIFLDFKITADGDCSHEIKTLASLKKSSDQPRQHIKKQRHYFVNKGPSSQVMVFPVVTYGYESWIIKKTEHRRIDVFELWYWRRLFRVCCIARRSNQSILKGDQSWVFIEKNDAKAETPVLWPPYVES